MIKPYRLIFFSLETKSLWYYKVGFPYLWIKAKKLWHLMNAVVQVTVRSKTAMKALKVHN